MSFELTFANWRFTVTERWRLNRRNWTLRTVDIFGVATESNVPIVTKTQSTLSLDWMIAVKHERVNSCWLVMSLSGLLDNETLLCVCSRLKQALLAALAVYCSNDNAVIISNNNNNFVFCWIVVESFWGKFYWDLMKSSNVLLICSDLMHSIIFLLWVL